MNGRMIKLKHLHEVGYTKRKSKSSVGLEEQNKFCFRQVGIICLRAICRKENKILKLGRVCNAAASVVWATEGSLKPKVEDIIVQMLVNRPRTGSSRLPISPGGHRNHRRGTRPQWG